jgi:hypothetical protein
MGNTVYFVYSNKKSILIVKKLFQIIGNTTVCNSEFRFVLLYEEFNNN